jgi:hypothetical protein
MHSHKLYVIVDRTLSRSQQAVQACHAVANFALKYGAEWQHQSIVLLGVDNLDELDKWYYNLSITYRDCKLKIAEFFEPYWDNRLTAIACHGCDDLVKELELL